MILWTFILSNLSKIGIGIAGIFGLFLYGKNSKLTRENKELQQNLESTQKVADIQSKVIEVTQNTKDVDLKANIERIKNKGL